MKVDLTYTELIEIAEVGLHIHENKQDGTDTCKKCGHDLRHPIHYGLEYFKEMTQELKERGNQ